MMKIEKVHDERILFNHFQLSGSNLFLNCDHKYYGNNESETSSCPEISVSEDNSIIIFVTGKFRSLK